jgi:hypothetical protein
VIFGRDLGRRWGVALTCLYVTYVILVLS